MRSRSAPSPARAQSADTLQAERSRLRAQLDKVNAEIDALKRAGGGVRDDYRLRARLADAESLARRLMDIEARLGIRVDGTAKFQPPPTAAPTDGPSDLDAKADILADQSRRVRAQADALARRAADLEGTPGAAPAGGGPRPRPVRADGRFEATGGERRRHGHGPGSGRRTPAARTSRRQDPINGDTVSDAGGDHEPSREGGGRPPLSVQLRDMLDTAALTDIRRLETSGAGAASPQTLERAAAALKARADWLEAQSRAMRAKAQATSSAVGAVTLRPECGGSASGRR